MKQQVASVHSCPKCRTEARKVHERTLHLDGVTRAIIERTERAYQDLDAEFEHERRAELAALGRGETPRPGQAKLDREGGTTEYPALVRVPSVEERFVAFMEQSTREKAEMTAAIVQQLKTIQKRLR